MDKPIFKVKGQTSPTALAGAIAGEVRKFGKCSMEAIGAGAVNQAVKAVAIATQHLATDGIIVSMSPRFDETKVDDKVLTIVKIEVDTVVKVEVA